MSASSSRTDLRRFEGLPDLQQGLAVSDQARGAASHLRRLFFAFGDGDGCGDSEGSASRYLSKSQSITWRAASCTGCSSLLSANQSLGKGLGSARGDKHPMSSRGDKHPMLLMAVALIGLPTTVCLQITSESSSRRWACVGMCVRAPSRILQQQLGTSFRVRHLRFERFVWNK